MKDAVLLDILEMYCADVKIYDFNLINWQMVKNKISIEIRIRSNELTALRFRLFISIHGIFCL